MPFVDDDRDDAVEDGGNHYNGAKEHITAKEEDGVNQLADHKKDQPEDFVGVH